MKKLLSVVLVLSLCLSMGISHVFADDINVMGVDIPGSGVSGDSLITPFAFAECGQYATHDMLSWGWGSIYDVDNNTYVVNNGACFQCTRCHLVLVCTHAPGTSDPIGYYTTWQPNEPLSAYVTNVRAYSKNIHYTSSNRLEGMSFRYSP